MSEVTLFKNTHGCVHVALKSGTTVAFTEGKLFTTNKQLQEELQRAADIGEFGIYVDINEPSIDPQFATPMDQLKKKLREELLAELAAGGRLVDAGVSVQKPLSQTMGSTEQVVGAAPLSSATEALKAAQIEDLNKPAAEATGALSALEKLKLQGAK